MWVVESVFVAFIKKKNHTPKLLLNITGMCLRRYKAGGFWRELRGCTGFLQFPSMAQKLLVGKFGFWRLWVALPVGLSSCEEWGLQELWRCRTEMGTGLGSTCFWPWWEGMASVPVPSAPMVAFASTRERCGRVPPFPLGQGFLAISPALLLWRLVPELTVQLSIPDTLIPESEQWLCACSIGHMMRLISCDVIISLCQQNGLILPIVWLDRQHWTCPALLASTKACATRKVCQCFCWCCLILCGSPVHVKQFLFSGTHRLCFCANRGHVGWSDLPKCIQASPDTAFLPGTTPVCHRFFHLQEESEANSVAFGSGHDLVNKTQLNCYLSWFALCSIVMCTSSL